MDVMTGSTCPWFAPWSPGWNATPGTAHAVVASLWRRCPKAWRKASPFSVNILALAIYLRFTHAISYRRLTQLFQHPVCPAHQRGRAGRDVPACQTVLRQRGGWQRYSPDCAAHRIICSDETTVRIERADPLELGVPERSGGDPCDPQQPCGQRRERYVLAEATGSSIYRSPTFMAPSRGMPISGRSVWRINYATANGMPSRRETRSSRHA